MRLLAILFAFSAGAACGWSQNGPAVRMDLSNSSLTPPSWSLTIYPDGSGHFHSEPGKVSAARPEAAWVLSGVDRDIVVSSGFADNVFKVARSHHFFGIDCESHLKVASLGSKSLSYTGPDGQGSCRFNYSKDPQIENLSDALFSVTNTILEGAKLESLLRYDRLGLDQEMEYLSEAADDGRAQQICAIRGILIRLAGDSAVLDRVKKRARILLSRAEN